MFGEQEMTSRAGKMQFFVFLFLIHFISYAASPLSYNFPGHRAGEHVSSPAEAPVPGKTIHIFLWELICAQLSVTQTDDNEDSPVRILIKKARAIIPQNIPAKLTPSGEREITIELCLILFLLSAAPLLNASGPQIAEGFSYLCGDRSPPHR
jgi:hypothetical protein